MDRVAADMKEVMIAPEALVVRPVLQEVLILAAVVPEVQVGRIQVEVVPDLPARQVQEVLHLEVVAPARVEEGNPSPLSNIYNNLRLIL